MLSPYVNDQKEREERRESVVTTNSKQTKNTAANKNTLKQKYIRALNSTTVQLDRSNHVQTYIGCELYDMLLGCCTRNDAKV